MKTRFLSGLVSTMILTMIVATIVPGDVSAQQNGWWTLSGLNLYPNSTSYNVGVGTTTPANNFHSMESNANVQAGQRYPYATGIFEQNGSSVIQIIGNSTQEKSINFAEPNHGAHGAIKYDSTIATGNISNGFSFWANGNQYKAAIAADGSINGVGTMLIGVNNPGASYAAGKFVEPGLGLNSILLAYSSISNPIPAFTVRTNGNVGIGVDQFFVNNILAIKQNSATDPIADAWTVYSSRRWKTNIQTIESALDKVKQLRGVSFDWKETGKHDIGVVAEEVGQVVPEAVAYEKNGVEAKSVDYGRLVAILIQAINEQQSQIEKHQVLLNAITDKKDGHIVALTDENNSAQKRIATLEQEVTTLKAEKAKTDEQIVNMEARLVALEKSQNDPTRFLQTGLLGSLIAGLALSGLLLGSQFLQKKAKQHLRP